MSAAERSLSIPYVDDDASTPRSLGNLSHGNQSLRSLTGNPFLSARTCQSPAGDLHPAVTMTTPQHRNDIVDRLFQSIANLLQESMVGICYIYLDIANRK